MRLSADRVHFSYGQHLVLNDMSLDVRAGELLAILGPNGAGKTTLLRTLSRQLPPSAGAVMLNRRQLDGFTRRQLASLVAHMPQHESGEAALRVADVVALGRAPRRGWFLPMGANDQKVIDEALESTGLTDLREREISQLSGGEWRRVVLARALAQQAKVMLLDEPTAGLDLKYQSHFLRLMKQMIAARRVSIGLTIHDINLAAAYADRIALMSAGKVVALGAASEVLQEPLLEEVFGIALSVTEHPVYGTPLVAPKLEP